MKQQNQGIENNSVFFFTFLIFQYMFCWKDNYLKTETLLRWKKENKCIIYFNSVSFDYVLLEIEFLSCYKLDVKNKIYNDNGKFNFVLTIFVFVRDFFLYILWVALYFCYNEFLFCSNRSGLWTERVCILLEGI